MNKKIQNEKMQRQALDFESSIHYLVEKSNKRAWLIAIIACVITFFAILAVFGLTPLKTTEPYVVRVDNTTGAVDIISVLNEEHIDKMEALDKHFIGAYVKAREGYFYDMLSNDYTFVQILSSDNVAAEYRAIYSGEKARDEVLKDNVQISVNILSIVLSDSNGVKNSTIRANLKIKNKNNKNIITQYKVITLSYEYQLSRTKEEYRILNPLGFKVLTYRIDEEIKR